MLCSGRELGLSDDSAGLLDAGRGRPRIARNPVDRCAGTRGTPCSTSRWRATGPTPGSMAGIARDLAARLGLAFTLPEPPAPPPSGRPVTEARTRLGRGPRPLPPSDGLGAERRRRRPLAAVDRRAAHLGRHATDQQRGRRVQLRDARAGQPTHPYDIERLGGPGLIVRRAVPGETVETLDGVTRTLGAASVTAATDCLICDGDNVPVGVAGIMGGASSEIADVDDRGAARGGLLHPHGHRPHLQAAGPADRGLGALRTGL